MEMTYQTVAEHPAGWRIPRKGRTAKEAHENAEAAVRAFHFSTYQNDEWVFTDEVLDKESEEQAK